MGTCLSDSIICANVREVILLLIKLDFQMRMYWSLVDRIETILMCKLTCRPNQIHCGSILPSYVIDPSDFGAISKPYLVINQSVSPCVHLFM
jgi:hypothetical protein